MSFSVISLQPKDLEGKKLAWQFSFDALLTALFLTVLMYEHRYMKGLDNISYESYIRLKAFGIVGFFLSVHECSYWKKKYLPYMQSFFESARG